MAHNLIGDGEVAEIYILNLKAYLRYIKPEEFGLPKELPNIDPFSYYITSGDAIKKTLSLRNSINIIISKLFSTCDGVLRYKMALSTLMHSVDKLLKDLEYARGNSLFLETEWADHILYVIPKNPRAK